MSQVMPEPTISTSKAERTQKVETAMDKIFAKRKNLYKRLAEADAQSQAKRDTSKHR